MSRSSLTLSKRSHIGHGVFGSEVILPSDAIGRPSSLASRTSLPSWRIVSKSMVRHLAQRGASCSTAYMVWRSGGS